MKAKVIDPTPHRTPARSSYVLKDLALKYYDTLAPIVNDLASKCIGEEEATLVFPAGKVIIKLI